MIIDDGTTENDLMTALMADYQNTYGVMRQPGDVTAVELAEKLKISTESARKYLNSKVESGELVSMKEIGTKTNLYRRRTVDTSPVSP